MKIEGLGNLIPDLTNQTKKVLPESGFTETFSELIHNVNEAQKDSAQSVKDFVAGNGVELHEVMIAGEKAKTSLELLMEIRNKAVDMYKELTRMPV